MEGVGQRVLSWISRNENHWLEFLICCCFTFLFDFKGDLYGAHLSVALVEFLRPELKMSSVEALVAQMEKDCELARTILADA